MAPPLGAALEGEPMSIQRELVQERVSAAATQLVGFARSSRDDQRAWAIRLLAAATRDLPPGERAAVQAGFCEVMRMFELAGTR